MLELAEKVTKLVDSKSKLLFMPLPVDDQNKGNLTSFLPKRNWLGNPQFRLRMTSKKPSNTLNLLFSKLTEAIEHDAI